MGTIETDMGYLLNDHTSCEINGKRGTRKEWDTVNCKHCQTVIKIIKNAQDGAWCTKCNGAVCNTVKCATQCTPFMERIALYLERERMLKGLGF